jgi:hypothetical protein
MKVSLNTIKQTLYNIGAPLILSTKVSQLVTFYKRYGLLSKQGDTADTNNISKINP